MCLGIPGQVVEIGDAGQERAVVDVDGVRREISVALLGTDTPEGVAVGDWVLVHVGFAMAKIDESDAKEALDSLRMLGEIYENELSELEASAGP